MISVCLDGKRIAASTGCRGVGIGHDKLGARQVFPVIDHSAKQILIAQRVNQQLDPVALEDGVVLRRILIKGKSVGKTAAAATGDEHAQLQVQIVLGNKQLAHLCQCVFG